MEKITQSQPQRQIRRERGVKISESRIKNREPKENNSTDAKSSATPPPISNMEERKWQRLLNRKGINSLMLEIENKNRKRGDSIDESNPW